MRREAPASLLPETVPREGAAPPIHCLVDGYNLALAMGTGVKSYARNLADTLVACGHRVDLLFGKLAARQATPDATAAGFFSREPAPGGRRRRILRSLRSFAAGDLFAVESDGRVAIGDLEDPLPRHHRILNGYSLYDRATIWFAATGRRLMIRVPDPPQIAHWTYPLPIAVRGAVNVYTLHDLIPLTHPWTSTYDKAAYDRLVRHLAKTGDHLVTVSDTMKQEIRQRLGVPEERITNTYQCVAEAFRPREDLSRLHAALGLQPRGFFLFVSAIEPHKNLWRVLQAHASLGTTTPLVIVGRAGLGADAYLSTLTFKNHGPFAMRAELPNGAAVYWIRHAPFALLTELMAGARALVQPSLVEGFGLPAVEAMKSGTPAIVSTHPAYREIVGEAAIAVDPTDLSGLTAAMQRLDRDEAERRRLAELGLARAARYSAERYAARVETLYRRLLSSGGRGGDATLSLAPNPAGSDTAAGRS